MRYFLLLLSAPLAWSQLAVTGPPTCQQGQTCTYSATGGTPPYTFSLMGGSVGSIASSGAYTAPAHVVPQQTINGCQAFPDNSIFNTPIGALPVHANSVLWMSNVDPTFGGITFGGDEVSQGSTVLSTDTPTNLTFVYSPNPPGGTNFIFEPFPDRVSEAGGALTAPGYLMGVDNHFLTTYRDTCQQQEVYNFYTAGVSPMSATANAGAGALFDLKSNAVPGWGTDAAGLPLTPLMLHQAEFIDAANGDLNAFKHAWRMTMDGVSLDAGDFVWPAQAANGAQFCQGPPTGGWTWTVTGNGTTTITATSLHGWHAIPPGATVTVDGTNYTIVGTGSPDPNFPGSYLSMTLSGIIASGSHSMTQPETNCMPYGSRLRLKSNYVQSSYYTGCTQKCQNIVQAIIRQLQQYGVIIADAGSEGNTDSEAGTNWMSYDAEVASFTLACNAQNCGFNGPILNPANFEVVDESSLQTNQTYNGTASTWMEAKLGNPYVTPVNSAVVTVTDSASNTAQYSVALQGVAIGVPNNSEVVVAGAAPFALTWWVTGTSNTAATCSMSPNGGIYGTMGSGCTYTPPPSVPTVTTTTAIISSVADPTVSINVQIYIIPSVNSGTTATSYLSVGKQTSAASYTDTAGTTWYNDIVAGRQLSLFPENNGGISNALHWTDYSGTQAYAAQAPGIYASLMGSYNDQHFRIHVPNGTVTGTLLPANSLENAANIFGFSFDCNGTIVHNQDDLFTFTGGTGIGRPLTCTQTVTDGLLHMALRMQGVNYGPHCGPSGNVNCYLAPSPGYGIFVAGLTVSSTIQPSYKKVTLCSSGCDYPLTTDGLQNAMSDAATYQDSTACIPYIIEGSGGATIQIANVIIPVKSCAQYVEIRSSTGNHFTPGQRYNPATDDAYAFNLQAVGNGPMFYVAQNTRYWRFRNVNFFTSITGGVTFPVTSASWAIGTGYFCSTGCTTLTLGPHTIPLSSTISINGVSPSTFNMGNTPVVAVTPTTISVQASTNPGPYVSGGTVQFLIGNNLSSFIQYGDNFDFNIWPDHLEILQSSLRGSGVGDVYKGLNNFGSNIHILDSYLANFSQLGSDSDVLGTYGGYDLQVRNSYLSAIDEDFIAGGTLMAAGMVPTFLNFTGNQITKEPWMNITNGSGAPSKPCYQGNWYHDNDANQDYVCSAVSGVWNLQPTLLPYIRRYPKNVWECKVCLGLRISGNDMGPMPAQSNQDPSFFQLELVTQPTYSCPDNCPQPYVYQAQPWTTIGDALIEANRLHDGFTPLILGYSYFWPCTDGPQPCYNYAHHNITFRNNLIPNVSDERNYCNVYGSNNGTCTVATGCGQSCGALGLLRLNDGGFDIDISHNTQTTSIFSANSGLMVGVGSIGTGQPTNSGMLSIRDNIFQMGVQGFEGYSMGINACALEAMLGPLDGALNLNTNIITQESPAGQTWVPFQTGSVFPGCNTANWPSNHAGGMSWTSLLDTNTYQVNNPAYKGWATDQRDPGADIGLVNWKTQHAVDGAPNPALDFLIRSIIPTSAGTSRGVQIHFTAPSTDACTWELSSDPNLYTSPVPVSSQARNGRDGLAVWNNGLLSPGTAYWARVTCDGNQSEELVNGNRAYTITNP